MILKNFYRITSYSYFSESSKLKAQVENDKSLISAIASNFDMGSYIATSNNTSSYYYDLNVLVGTSDQAVDVDDPSLVSLLMPTNDTSTAQSDENKIYFASGMVYAVTFNNSHEATIKISTTYTNLKTEPITIKEIGIGSINSSSIPQTNTQDWTTGQNISSQVSSYSASACITRDVLSTPIIMQPNETYTFTINITGIPCGMLPPST